MLTRFQQSYAIRSIQPRIGQLVAITSALIAMTITSQAQTVQPSSSPPIVVAGAITMPSGQKITSFDIGFVDPAINRYILGDRTNRAVEVVDTTNNTLVAQIGKGLFVGFTGNNDTSGPDGVVIVGHKEVWAGDGDSTLKIFDLATQALTHTISTGGTTRVDEMCHDPVDHVVAMMNNAESPPFLTFVSTQTYTILGKVSFDGNNGTPKATNGAEQCQWNYRTGTIFVSIPEVNGPGNNSVPGAVVEINPVTRAVLHSYSIPVANCAGPQGLTIGPRHEIGLGCNKTSSAIIDERDGSVLGSSSNDGGADMAWYNPGDGNYYLGESNNTAGPTLGVISSELGFPSQHPSTGAASAAHSVAADPILNQIYVPISSASTGNICTQGGGTSAQGCIAIYKAAPSTTSVFAAVTPNARTTTVNGTVTAFATMINAGTSTATACTISTLAGFPGNFKFQTTDKNTNQPTGNPNAPANIGPGASQSFFFAITPTQTITQDTRLIFNCTNANPAPAYPGLDTFLFASSATSIPDMLSIVQTPTHDGNILLPPNATAIMVAAAMNIGAAGSVTFTPTDTPAQHHPRNLPLDLSICQTDSGGNCMSAPSPSVTLTVTNGQTVTFTVFVTRNGISLPYVPAYNRVFLVATQGSTPVGEASAAVLMTAAATVAMK